MEFPFSVNDLLPDSITVVDEKLAPFRSRVLSDRYDLNHKQLQLKKVIDAMGEASGKAQNLRGAITAALKLQCSDHKLYIMKDAAANSGKGAVVGILKTGYKKLFLLDLQHVQNEVKPLCVLDFYVHESKQRMGYGKSLFQHMLKLENVQPAQIAIDRPSAKLISFVKKHYDLKKVIPQVNNFVVFDQFFRDLQAVGYVPKGGQRLAGGNSDGNQRRPPIHPYRRHSQQNSEESGVRTRHGRDTSRLSSLRTASRESREMPMSSHGLPPQSSDVALKNITLPPLGPRPPSTHSRPGSRETASGTRRDSAPDLRKTSSNELINTEYNVTRGLAARATCYSRHSLPRGGSASDKNRRQQNTSEFMDTSTYGCNVGSASLTKFSSDIPCTKTAGNNDTTGVSSRTGSGKTFSAGRRRNLHVTSSDNILGGVNPVSSQYRFPGSREINKPQTVDTNANEANTSTGTATNPNYISSSGNYSVSSVYNAHFGRGKGTGLSTSWNVLGVPSFVGHQTPNHPYYARGNTQPRTFPF